MITLRDVCGAGKLYFKPDKTKFWVLEESLIETRARVCPACGHIQLRADAAKLRKLMPKRAAGNG